MALIFQRIARNLAKDGYFPTDVPTVARIAGALQMDGAPARVLDPCCGEGLALEQLVRSLDAPCTTYGIEIDDERVVGARERLDHVLWSDIQNTQIDSGAFDLLFLNPPYGPLVSDKAMTGDETITRFEELFVRRTIPLLAADGVLALIIPWYELRERMCGWLARNFDRVTVWRGAVDTFKQVVVFGVRRKTPRTSFTKEAKALMELATNPMAIPEIPEVWVDEPYLVRGTCERRPVIRFGALEVDPLMLEDMAPADAGLWPSFAVQMGQRSAEPNRPPLHGVSDWHIALLLVSGAIDGKLSRPDGTALLLKGSTPKASTIKVDKELVGEEVSEITVIREKFVPQIMAIDITRQSNSFGQIFQIQ